MMKATQEDWVFKTTKYTRCSFFTLIIPELGKWREEGRNSSDFSEKIENLRPLSQQNKTAKQNKENSPKPNETNK